jgi:hypothetical protein
MNAEGEAARRRAHAAFACRRDRGGEASRGDHGEGVREDVR